MRGEARARREDTIIEAAFKLLDSGGVPGMSMLAVATAARASNETLYKWYGDKSGLLGAMVVRHGAEIRGVLESAGAEADASPLEVLDRLGPELLTLLTGARATALSQAAASDPEGALGAALLQEVHAPLEAALAALCRTALDHGALRGGDAAGITRTYLDLLLGDWPLRRVIGEMPVPDAAQVRSRADRALMLTWRLHGREQP